MSNPGPAPVVALRIGEARLARLGPGESAVVTAEAPAPAVAARFDPADWARALDDLAPGWAETHLRTAGHFLDTVDAGPAGDPDHAINLRLLAAVEPATAADWTRGPPLRLALVARALRHAPPEALPPLLAAVDPAVEHPPWPAAYAALPPLADAVRLAIEAHGAAALPALRAAPRWRADRGLDAGQLDPDPPPPAADAPARLAAALGAGDFDAAAAIAARLVRGPLDPDADPETARRACGALDTAAQRALRAGRLLAAEGWLRRAAPVCGDDPATRDRAAALFRARGDLRRGRGDLVGAVGWYRPAFWLAEAPVDRARLADTHAELALLRYGEGAFAEGDRHLEAARALDSLRPRVQAAIDARPTADPRARVGIAFIALLMALFVARRLRRVLRRGPGIPG